jgi:hypothetical protein
MVFIMWGSEFRVQGSRFRVVIKRRRKPRGGCPSHG